MQLLVQRPAANMATAMLQAALVLSQIRVTLEQAHRYVLIKEIQFLPMEGTYARVFGGPPGLHYVTTIKVNQSTVVPPVNFSISSVSYSGHINMNDEEQIKAGVMDLIFAESPPQDDPLQCGKAASITAVEEQFFCIQHGAGDLYITDAFDTSTKISSGAKYELKVQVVDSSIPPESATVSVVVGAVSKCFPVDYLYENVKNYCPNSVKSYPLPFDPFKLWPTTDIIMKLNETINVGRVLLQVALTNLTTGCYLLRLSSQSKRFSQPFRFNASSLDSPLCPNELDSVVNSQGYLNVYLMNPFEATGQLRIEVSSFELQPVSFHDASAVIVDGAPPVRSCPNMLCWKFFHLWADAIDQQLEAGYPKCVDMSSLQYTRLEACRTWNPNITIQEVEPKKMFALQYLTCDGIMPTDGNVNWYLNGDPVGISPSGHSVVADDYRQQGYYQCELLRDGKVLSSNKVLVVFSDVLTASVDIRVTSSSYEAGQRTASVQQTMANHIRNISNSMNALSTETTVSSDQKARVSSYWTTLRFLCYFRVGDGVDRVPFLLTFEKRLRAAASHGRFSPLNIDISSITVISHEICLPSITGESSSRGRMDWPPTRVLTTVVLPCAYGGSDSSRLCAGNFSVGAQWNEPDTSSCPANSTVTADLSRLSQETLNASTAGAVTTQVKELTQEVSTITSDDTILISQILTNVLKIQALSQETSRNVLQIVTNLLNVDEGALASAERQDGAVSTFVRSVEEVAEKLASNTSRDNLAQESTDVIGVMKVNFVPRSFEGAVVAINVGNGNQLPEKPFLLGTSVGSISKEANTVRMPSSIYKDAGYGANDTAVGISAAYFTDVAFFPLSSSRNGSERLTHVLSIKVGERVTVRLSEPIQFSMKVDRSGRMTANYTCVYWSFPADGRLGEWLTDGCNITHAENDRVTCSCNHLTNFAVIFDVKEGIEEKMSKEHILALSIITYVGCGLSLAGILITIISLTLFRFLRRNTPSKVLIMLSASLGMVLVIFVLLVDRPKPKWLCTTSAALLHYFILNTFAWTCVEAITLYLKVVKVMGHFPSKFLLKASFSAFGLPAVVVGVSVGINPHDYGNKQYCVVGGLSAYIGLFLPTCAIILFNVVVFILVVISLIKSTSEVAKIGNKNEKSSHLRIAASVVTLLNITWIFGVLAVTDARIVFQYLFCIFNSFQGLFIFYFNIVRQVRVRLAWANFVSGKGTTYDMSNSVMATLRVRSSKTPKKLRRVDTKAGVQILCNRFNFGLMRTKTKREGVFLLSRTYQTYIADILQIYRRYITNILYVVELPRAQEITICALFLPDFLARKRFLVPLRFFLDCGGKESMCALSRCIDEAKT